MAGITLNKWLYGSKTYFLITSLGQMGTFWLASQLNKHTQVFCTHAYDKPLWGAANAPLRGQEGERQRDMIHRYFSTLPLRGFFKEHVAATNKSIIGNAHAYNIDQALLMMKDERLQDIKVVNLIRHPISRIHSTVNCVRNEWLIEGYIDHLRHIPLTYVREGRALINELFPSQLAAFDDSLEKQFFVYAILHEKRSAGHAALAEANRIPNLRYEDLTGSKDHLQKLIQYVSNNKVTDTHDWINNQISFKKLNPHAGAATDTAQALYATWEPWKKELYQHLLQDKNMNIYRDKGYYSI